MNAANLPPNVSITDQVILFDGMCKLCNAWSNFIIKHDHEHATHSGKKNLLEDI